MSETSATPVLPAPPPASFFDRFSERQMTIGVLLFGLLLYLPFAGSYGLFDPWETHYGEVARQMAERHDFVSLYWPGSPLDSEHFWSKPVLSFWLMSLAMKVAGVGRPDAPGEMAVGTAAEWALRVPFCLMALAALYGVYLVASRFVSRRAGVIAVVALGTFPMFSLVARQAMTDMAFVGPMTLALALGTLALFEEDDRELPRRTWRGLSWPHHRLFYLTLGLFAVCALPQLVVNSIQAHWTPPFWRREHRTVPGVVIMLPYFLGFLAFVYFSARARFKAPFYLFLAAILCALAVLAKGLAGLGLPVIVFLAYLLFTWNWRRLQRAQLLYGVLVALLACAVVAIPWHHAMLALHGQPWWEELYGDNHWRRLVVGRHGDRGAFEYFVREGAYGILPWVALAPIALCWSVLRRFQPADAGEQRDRVEAQAASPPEPHREGFQIVDRRQEILWLGAIWFVSSYAVVSLSMTKFHHYILPALPGLALVLGCFLDDLLDHPRPRVLAAAALVGLPVLGLVVHDLATEQKDAQHFIWLFSYDYVNTPNGRPWPMELDFRPALIAFAALFALPVLAAIVRRAQRFALPALGVLAVAFTYFLLDVYIPKTAARWSQKPLIARYYQERRSPDEPLVAWQMYWRGETFYTKNAIWSGPREQRTVFLGDKNQEDLKAYLGRSKGKRVFFVVEQARWSTLASLIPAEARPSLRKIEERQNNKFYLAVVDL
jgi:4-amino-4-deoxy-L-arabinose transferase-like glycosyltransferase